MKTKAPHDKFYSILRLFPGADKESIVWQYSGMLTTSLREFWEKRPEEYRRMLADLQAKVYKKSGTGDDPEVKKLRSAVLTRLQKHGVDTTDWACVNSFLSQPRIANKRLYEMTTTEMRALIKKLESILAKDIEVRENEARLSNCN